MIGARCGSTSTWHLLSIFLLFKYPVGAVHGQRPISTLARSPRLTLTTLLSFSSFACAQNHQHEFLIRIVAEFLPIGAYLNKLLLSMRSTILPKSPAFRDIRSGAHVRMPLYLPCFSFLALSR